MMYRAKITKIEYLVNVFYSGEDLRIRKDVTDKYLELASEDEAEILEEINRVHEETEKAVERAYEWQVSATKELTKRLLDIHHIKIPI